MSIMFDRLKSNLVLKEIQSSEYFTVGRSEGEPYLFLNMEPFESLMGHYPVYFENGVLLTLKDEVKYFNNSKSYVFYDNKGKEILEIYNTKKFYNPKTGISEPVPPKFDIEIKIYKGNIYVKETDFETKEENEYFIDIKTKNKIIDVFEKKNNEETFTI